MYYKIFITILACFVIISVPVAQKEEKFPLYRVVLDPGHGGVVKYPVSIHGDRHDPVSGKYIDIFRPGASRGKLEEKVLMWGIAVKTEKLLSYLKPGGDFARFQKILAKYTDELPPRISIITQMSRKKCITAAEAAKQKDPNGPYRLFDYPGSDKKLKPGRLTVINNFKPHLVVSLHCAEYFFSDYRGMNPVLLAPYSLLKQGLDHLNGTRIMKNPYEYPLVQNWFVESNKRSKFQWFLHDSAVYFAAYNINTNYTPNYNLFRGYRYNMLQWAYNDPPGWEKEARKHKPWTQYSRNYKTFKPQGVFWEREQSIYEEYRRNKGYEGFGGDNAYASYELIRYVIHSLKDKGDKDKSLVAGKPYPSIWIVPHYVNAINAYLELGYLSRAEDRIRLTQNQDAIAEGLAVGIYSLFTGMKIKKRPYPQQPKGLKLDLEKYRIDDKQTYFDIVTQ